MPLTDARLAEIAARHVDNGYGGCDYCCVSGDHEALPVFYPCDAALLAQDNQRLRQGLAALEHAPSDSGGEYCMVCFWYAGAHAPGCALAALIGGTDG